MMYHTGTILAIMVIAARVKERAHDIDTDAVAAG